jgi:hypothetical protein
MWLGVVSGAILFAWVGWTLYVLRAIEHPTYKVLETHAGFEVREYEPYLTACVSAQGTHQEALYEGFNVLATYIFGGNTKKESISMTAPVTEGVRAGERIAMTAPVTETKAGENRRVCFSMPRSYTRETLPTPNDARVEFEQVPVKKYAALRFTWYATESRVTRKGEELLKYLLDANLTPVSAPVYAGYNDPWSFPLLMRNEILVEVQ